LFRELVERRRWSRKRSRNRRRNRRRSIAVSMRFAFSPLKSGVKRWSVKRGRKGGKEVAG
jgi:hypothetical protein